MNRAPIAGVSHVAIKVSDIERSMPFYQEFLGYAEQARLNDLNTGELKLICLKVSENQQIEVFTGLKPGGDRIHQIAFRVESAEAMADFLAAKGCGSPKVGRGQMRNAGFCIQDPNGYTLEFTQYMPDGWTVRDHGKFLPDTRISSHLSHAGVVTSKLAETFRLYQEIFGFQETWRGSRKGDFLTWINLAIPDSPDYLELMLDPESAPHFCLFVDDMDAAKAKLDRNSYRSKYEKPIEIQIGKNRKKIINLFDPDGIRIELMEPNTIDGTPTPSSPAPYPERFK